MLHQSLHSSFTNSNPGTFVTAPRQRRIFGLDVFPARCPHEGSEPTASCKKWQQKKHVFYGVLQGLQGCFLWGLRGSSSIFWGGDVFIHITWKRGESDSWFGLPRLPTFGVWMVSSYSTTSHHYNLHPWKLTCPLWNLTLKGTIWIGNTSSNHPFSGAMLVAGRVCFQTFDCFPYFLRMWKIAIGR